MIRVLSLYCKLWTDISPQRSVYWYKFQLHYTFRTFQVNGVREAYFEATRTPMMELFANIVNGF